MRNWLKCSLPSGLVILAVCLFVPPTYGQDAKLTQLLEQRIRIPFTVTRDTSHSALGKLAANYNIPLADEISSGDRKDESSRQFYVESGTVRDVLDAVAASNPDYQITVEQGIVRVSYKDNSLRDPFLDIRVSEFKIENKDAEEIKQTVARLPEVKGALSPLGLEVRAPFGRLGAGAYPRASLSIKNATIREIFDALIKTRKFKYWGILRWGENNRFIRIILW
jgi:hypothetical protein